MIHMSTSIGLVSVTPNELNFQLNIGQRLNIDEIHYITSSSVFETFLQRDLEESEEIHYIDEFALTPDSLDESETIGSLFEEVASDSANLQSFMYSDYRYQNEALKKRLARIDRANKFWRHLFVEWNIDYVLSCSGGEYARRCGYYISKSFDADFYFTYSVFPSRENSRVVFEPTEMQQIMEGDRSEVLSQSELRRIIDDFREDDDTEFSRSISKLPVELDDVLSFHRALKGELKIRLSNTDTDFGWDIGQKICSQLRGHFRYHRNSDLYLDGPPAGPFVVLALHSNQDAQITCREPRFFNNQFALVRAVSNLLPYPYTLCVKEHPVEAGKRTAGQLRRIQSEQENVEFIDPKLSPSSLFDEAAAIVTIRSTIGLEALLHGCSVVTFGRPYYTNTGITTSATFDDIEPSLTEAIEDDGPDRSEVEGLISYLWQSSYSGDTMGNLSQWNVPHLVAAIESFVNE